MLKFLRIAGFAWALFLSVAYFWPSDALYAITIWPAFVWASLGFVLALAGIRRHRNRRQYILLGLWLGFWLGFGEEKRWIPARFMPISKDGVEVVSLNCAGGSTEAAREGLASRPQIALLQESPSKPEVEKLVRQIYGASGSVLVGPDASIVVDGEIVPINLNFGNTNFVAALVKQRDLGSLLLVSARLQPPTFRLDYWNPDCWRAYAEDRRRRRQELAELVEYVKDLAPERLVIGGDFNTPPDKGTFAPFDGFAAPATEDSGYTAVNEFPMARIDQVWTKGLQPIRSRAERTAHSDHRIVRVWFKPD